MRPCRQARSRRWSSSGGNPVFDAPADLDFASALAKVPQSIALGHSVDETSVKTTWHLPRAHYLESWGDARAVGGPLSVVQPLILPLFGGRTAIEVLGLMAGDKDRPGYEIVRETWTPILGAADFDTKWNRVLHDGLLAGSELPEVVPTLTAEPLAELARSIGGGAARPVPQAAWRWSSSPPPRCTTAASPTTAGCRSFPIPSPS